MRQQVCRGNTQLAPSERHFFVRIPLHLVLMVCSALFTNDVGRQLRGHYWNQWAPRDAVVFSTWCEEYTRESLCVRMLYMWYDRDNIQNA